MSLTREEVDEKLTNASSVEEVKAIIEENGGKLSEEEAKDLYERIKAYDPSAVVELSVEELDEVAGGKRSFLYEGCESTVEAGSHCFGSDACDLWNVQYKNRPAPRKKCPNCNDYTMCFINKDKYICYKCKFEHGTYYKNEV